MEALIRRHRKRRHATSRATKTLNDKARPVETDFEAIRKPTDEKFIPDADCIYVGTSGFEALKDRVVKAAAIEFIDCGEIQTPDPSTTTAPDSQNGPRPHRNHVVLRLQTGSPVTVDLGHGVKAAQGVVCSVEESSEESSKGDDRCYFAMKPIEYCAPTRAASAVFKFKVCTSFTPRDVLNTANSGELLPFRYKNAGREGDRKIVVGCRDWMTQLFCRLHQAGYLGWKCVDTVPRRMSPGFKGASFARIIGHRYSGIRTPNGCPDLPIITPSLVDRGTFATDSIRLLEYEGGKLPYYMDNTEGDGNDDGNEDYVPQGVIVVGGVQDSITVTVQEDTGVQETAGVQEDMAEEITALAVS